MSTAWSSCIPSILGLKKLKDDGLGLEIMIGLLIGC